MAGPDTSGATPGRRELRAGRTRLGLHAVRGLRSRAVRTSLGTATVGSVAIVALLTLHTPPADVTVADAASHRAVAAATASGSASAQGSPVDLAVPAVGSSASASRLGWTLRIDALSIATQVDAMTAENGVVNPPALDSAYWLSAYGTPSPDSTNTVYLAGHSWSRGPAVFNSLTNATTQKSSIPIGTEIELVTDTDRLTYVVDATARYPKTKLPTTKDVWAIVPGRLVIITCFLHEGVDRSPDNFVVYAHLIGSER